mmetsp:Transcript_21838/g.43338  ORF Transcript_21838/g.43338 Transcript_21838/m.43338 type:complete len:267 (-) Transcript_21838:250-1050(-)
MLPYPSCYRDDGTDGYSPAREDYSKKQRQYFGKMMPYANCVRDDGTDGYSPTRANYHKKKANYWGQENIKPSPDAESIDPVTNTHWIQHPASLEDGWRPKSAQTHLRSRSITETIDNNNITNPTTRHIHHSASENNYMPDKTYFRKKFDITQHREVGLGKSLSQIRQFFDQDGSLHRAEETREYHRKKSDIITFKDAANGFPAGQLRTPEFFAETFDPTHGKRFNKSRSTINFSVAAREVSLRGARFDPQDESPRRFNRRKAWDAY